MSKIPKKEAMKIAIDLYSRGYSLHEAAEVVGVSVSGLWKRMVREGVARRSQGRTRKLSSYLRETILREHLVDGLGISAIAAKHNLSKSTVRRVFAEEGKLTYTLQQLKKLQASKRDAALSDRILDLYRRGYPVKEIARTCRTSQRRVSRIVREFVKSLSQPHTQTTNERSRSVNVGEGEDSGLGHRGQ